MDSSVRLVQPEPLDEKLPSEMKDELLRVLEKLEVLGNQDIFTHQSDNASPSPEAENPELKWVRSRLWSATGALSVDTEKYQQLTAVAQAAEDIQTENDVRQVAESLRDFLGEQ